MSVGPNRISPVMLLIMLGSFAVTVGISAWMVRSLGFATTFQFDLSNRLGQARGSKANPAAVPPIQALQPGVWAEIAFGAGSDERTVERRLPTMAFALRPGESLDPRVPPGPFRAEFDVPFYTGDVREARLGVEFEGGKVMLIRNDAILLSDATGDKPRTVLTSREFPVRLHVHQDAITIAFESDGKQPCRLRAIWQPEEAMIPLPLPVVTSPLLADDQSRGFALVQQFNCAACHVSGDRNLQSILTANAAPILGDAGARLRTSWISAWLKDPQSIKPGAMMPAMNLDGEAIEDITHFLASMGGPDAKQDASINADLVNTGMAAYHTVGCFACHGPLERIDQLPGGHPASSLQSVRSYESMGRPSQKWSADRLADFLRDPVAHWPSGRMPSLSLQPSEAESIAAYLIDRDLQKSEIARDDRFKLDPARVERGRAKFAAAGCANCHSLGPDRPAIASMLNAHALESLSANSTLDTAGCVAKKLDERSPHFDLNDAQRRSIAAFLRSLAERRTSIVPIEQLGLTMARLNCTACHAFNGDRGPEAYVAQYFSAIEEADLGDEGREPPNLSDVGGKLNPQWLHDVLVAGRRARPYLGTRMPQFGEKNVGDLPWLLAAAAGEWPKPDQGPSLSSDDAEVGRQLVGAKAMNCIQCHNVAGHASTGTPGPDLAQMAERLRYDAFSRWIHDPKLTRPGTRMPSFFVNGMSGFTDLLGGDADKQVDAIWGYLSLGEFMPLPDGLTDASSLMLDVKNEPVIFRSFIQGAGVRAIAVGYPEQIHVAFDADKCRLAEVWEGQFINAAGAWANRGGTETNPDAETLKWKAPVEPLFVSASMPGESSHELTTRFRGYRLDEHRRPTFVYELRAGEIEILVSEQPMPSRAQNQAKLTQQFTLEGPKGARVIVAPGHRLSRGLSGDTSDGIGSITLDEQGKAAFDLEVTW